MKPAEILIVDKVTVEPTGMNVTNEGRIVADAMLVTITATKRTLAEYITVDIKI